ncbi:methyltransferase [Candidatus Methylospira mobilis]|uniref:Methyltransferase n=1 Tax=Candidatus Methylospira mobilis TaxID=1808979 RepID=A0A5Q0BKX7_9GAMM|nr:methyltransferase [Candidatus Methylospira mobilis]QFY44493.1 methyltransferase [Candidatus Methylospira mobilis]
MEIKFALGPGKEITLASAPGVFTPNMTTSLLIQAVGSTVGEPVDLLDLGCGTGVVGVALYQQGLIKTKVSASDLSEAAVKCSRDNFERYACPAEVRCGTLFEPWVGMKFEVIVDDISGISQSVADVSPWFQGVPCETGEDGVDLVAEIIRSAPQYLKEGGRFFFPVLSLSSVDRILQVARETFFTVEKVGRREWPLPAELKAHLPLLRKLGAEGAISLEERFGMVVCYTETYLAMNPY